MPKSFSVPSSKPPETTGFNGRWQKGRRREADCRPQTHDEYVRERQNDVPSEAGSGWKFAKRMTVREGGALDADG